MNNVRPDLYNLDPETILINISGEPFEEIFKKRYDISIHGLR